MRARAFLCALAAALAAALPAAADDLLRVGESPSWVFAYIPLQVGLKEGYFAKRGLEIQVVGFEGAAKMDQAMVAGAIDVSLGSPMNMASMAKGMPSIAIADIAQPMRELAILVPYDSPAKSLDDLKGKTFAIATEGSITEWAALELAAVKGWGGIRTVAIGSGAGANAAALKAHLVDADVGDIMNGVVLERDHVARQLADVSDYARPFVAHIMSASRAEVARDPDALRRFVAGWFEGVAFMQAHEDETLAIAEPVTGLSPADQRLEYERLMPEVRAEGQFDQATLGRMAQTFVELHVLARPPDTAKLYTDRFLPPK